ncbi:unnamed protein product [Urochloa decumbens]|uniref:Uncharacterized protein n=1 Tax=Urochloa decumbens TaxID=240449 RepID=A0ABC8ZW30_9POAL
MSSDDVRKRLAKCCEEFDNISKQIPLMIEKMEALYLQRKTEGSAEKSEGENNTAPGTLTPDEMVALYKDLEASLRGFLKALGKKVEEAGSTSQAAPPGAKDM